MPASKKEGIDDVKEAMTAVNELGILLFSRFKDGVQFGDFAALWEKLIADEDFKAMLSKAYENYQKIPDELEDLDTRELMELTGLQLGFMPRIIEAIKA